ncbi:MAG: hypothetical protein HXY49_09915 [Ignavibacteriaceae bacterium]|nr:hypothetical protein [Ignavibacteriaceae bacterium]
MNNIKYFLTILIAATLLGALLVGCEGPAGPKGDKGDKGDPGDSYINWDGFKQGIVCADCHNYDYDTTYYVWARKYQWDLSKHAIGGDFERNSSSCSNCHTTEGYLQSLRGQTVTAHVNGSPPGCFACHSPHSNADFSLRTVAPVTIISAVDGVADYVFDYGKGNLCVSCHKTRTISPEPNPSKTASTDTIKITTNRWYPHYGVQGQMLAGVGGFEFQNYTYTSSFHTTSSVIKADGCAICHMADPTAGGGIGGGHTMNIEYLNTSGNPTYLLNGCTITGCHPSAGFTIDYNQSHTQVEALLDSLHTLLLNRNWIDPSTGLVNASSSNPLRIAPAFLAGALFNYYFVEHDLSKGSHNFKYAKQLLESSIEVLNSN